MNPVVTNNQYYTILAFMVELGGFVYLLVILHGLYWETFGVGRGETESQYSRYMTRKLVQEMDQSL